MAMTSDRELYLGHLPQGIGAEQLRPIFEAYGDLMDVRVVRDKNIGFVTYRSHEAAAMALQDVTQSSILGVECDIKWAVPRSGGGGGGGGAPAPMQPMLGIMETVPQKKVFVGNLSPGVSDMDLNAAFQSFGRIIEVKVLNSNPMKPFGFVTYATLEEAQLAMEHLDGSVHPSLCADGKALSVKPSDPPGVKTLPSGTRLITTPSSRGLTAGGLGGGGFSAPAAAGPAGPEAQIMEMLMTQCELAAQHGEQVPESVLQMIQQLSMGAGARGAAPVENKIFIGNLPLDATDEYLRGMMSMVSTQITSIKVTQDHSGMIGFVSFSSAAEAERLIGALHDIPNGAMMGRTLSVRWADRGQKRAGDFGGFGGAMKQHRPDVWPELTGTPAARGRLPEKVFIGSLPKTITDSDVVALCQSYGAVQSVRLIRKEAKPTTALVQFLTEQESETCIANLHDQQILDEKPLVARFAVPLRNEALRGVI